MVYKYIAGPRSAPIDTTAIWVAKPAFRELVGYIEQHLSKPFKFSYVADQETYGQIKEIADEWGPLLLKVNLDTLILLHAYFHERREYETALACIDIVISRLNNKRINSTYYSWRSDTLHQLAGC